jgi:hypothetical protein
MARHDPLDDVALDPGLEGLDEPRGRGYRAAAGGEGGFWSRVGGRIKAFAGRLVSGERRAWRWTKRTVLVLVVIGIGYYGIGAAWVHTIDDDLAFQPAQTTEGGSRAVDMAAALILREVEEHAWTANDPFFLPGWVLDNMPNYQQGIIYALSRFAVEMADQVGRARGSSQVDPDLDRASGLLRYPGDRWYFDLSAGLAPQATAESQYLDAARRLSDYNTRLAAGEAAFDPRADNLRNTLDRIAADLGSASARIDEHIAVSAWFPYDTVADDIFYENKGRLYGYAMVLEALGADFAEVIATTGVGTVWGEMLASLRIAASLDPLVVANGAPGALLFPNHLSAQGFYLLRARTQLREVSNVLAN